MMRPYTTLRRDSNIIVSTAAAAAARRQRWFSFVCLCTRRSLRMDRGAIVKIIVLLHIFAFITVLVVYRHMGRLSLSSVNHSTASVDPTKVIIVAPSVLPSSGKWSKNYAEKFDKDDALSQLLVRKQQLTKLIAEAEQEKRQLLSDVRVLSSRLLAPASALVAANESRSNSTLDEASFPAAPFSSGQVAIPCKTCPPSAVPPLSLIPLNTQQQIAVLVIACDRLTVRRNLDLLVRYRDNHPNNKLNDSVIMKQRFPIIVSQDCGHAQTAQIINSFVQRYDNVQHIKQPDQSNIVIHDKTDAKFQGYYRICRHYKWALSQVFKNPNNYSAVIVVEDDLDVAPDFYDYFQALVPVLHADKSLWCVSAWNDNGKPDLIEQNEHELIHRTDFFPGLGWMMLRELWQELEPKWPTKFWDDWMRRPEQRQNRSCIRPEISRTSTFGKKGVSKGQFFDQHLKFIKLNDKPVRFGERDLSFLLKSVYDLRFNNTVYAAPAVTLQNVKSGLIANVDPRSPVRLTYRTKADFVRLATEMGAMVDLKAGVARTAYRGVVMITYKGRRVFLAPPVDWGGYDNSWS